MDEESTTVREDLGYRTNTNQNVHPLFPKSRDREILNVSRDLLDNRIRVTYTKGIAQGLTHILRRDIAEDLIQRGYAQEGW